MDDKGKCDRKSKKPFVDVLKEFGKPKVRKRRAPSLTIFKRDHFGNRIYKSSGSKYVRKRQELNNRLEADSDEGNDDLGEHTNIMDYFTTKIHLFM